MKKISRVLSMATVFLILLSSLAGFKLDASERVYTKQDMQLSLNRMRNLDTSQEEELLSSLDDDVIIIDTSAWYKDDSILQLNELSKHQEEIVDEANLYLIENNIVPEIGEEFIYEGMKISADDTGSVILTTSDFKAYLSEVAYFDTIEVEEQVDKRGARSLVYWKTRNWSTRDRIYVTMKRLTATGATILAYKIPFIGLISTAAGLYNIWNEGTYTRTTYYKDVYKVYSQCTNNGAGIRYRTGYTVSARTVSQKISTSQYKFSSDSYRC